MNICLVTKNNVVDGRIMYEGARREADYSETVFFSVPKENSILNEGDEFLVADDSRPEVKRYKCIGAIADGGNVNVSGRS